MIGRRSLLSVIRVVTQRFTETNALNSNNRMFFGLVGLLKKNVANIVYPVFIMPKTFIMIAWLTERGVTSACKKPLRIIHLGNGLIARVLTGYNKREA